MRLAPKVVIPRRLLLAVPVGRPTFGFALVLRSPPPLLHHVPYSSNEMSVDLVWKAQPDHRFRHLRLSPPAVHVHELLFSAPGQLHGLVHC